jgi:hypothetical protein
MQRILYHFCKFVQFLSQSCCYLIDVLHYWLINGDPSPLPTFHRVHLGLPGSCECTRLIKDFCEMSSKMLEMFSIIHSHTVSELLF